jgi:hypothetical protein
VSDKTDAIKPVYSEHRRRHRGGQAPKIESDPELRAWFDKNIAFYTFDQLAALARERFGPQRAPAHTSIGRYWHRNKERLFPELFKQLSDAEK